MIQVSVQQTKQKEFSKAVNALKKYIYAEVPIKSDKKLSELLETVLNMMFYEDNLKVKKHYYGEWYAFVAWLLLEVNIPPRLLLDYLKLVQNIIRNKYSRYSVNIDYYFDPEVFKKSFTHKKFLQKRLKHIFLKQLVQVLNKNAKRKHDIQVEQILAKQSPQQVVMAQQVVMPTAPQKKVVVIDQSKKLVSQEQKPIKTVQSLQQKVVSKPDGLLGDIRKGLVLKKKPVPQQQQKDVVEQSQTVQSKQQKKKESKPSALLLGDIRKGLVLKKKPVQQQQQKKVKKQQSSLLGAIKKGVVLKKTDSKSQKTQKQQQQQQSNPMLKALKQRRKYIVPDQQQNDDEFL
jgi:hypothetical protein